MNNKKLKALELIMAPIKALHEECYSRIKQAIISLDKNQAADIYAISFYIDEYFDGDEPYCYLPKLELNYNTNAHLAEEVKKITPREASDNWTMDDCAMERKWNYAYWLQNCILEIQPREGAFKDYIDVKYPPKVGKPDEEIPDRQNEEFWNGFQAILVKVAIKLHDEGLITSVFGRQIPIVIHGLTYSFEQMYMTAAANPDGQAKEWMDFNFYNPKKLKQYAY